MANGNGSKEQVATTKNTEREDVLSLAKNVAFLASIYLYFAGWVYLYQYFKHFGVSLLGLDIPLTYFFVYAYPLLTRGITLWKFALLSVVVLMAFVAMSRFRWMGRFQWMTRYRRWMSQYRKAIMLVLTLALFPISFQAARESAEANAISFRKGEGSRVVRFTLTKEAAQHYPAAFIEANDGEELLLLLETKDRFYVVWQPSAPQDGPKDELPMASTFSIDRTSVSVADVDVPNASSRE